MKIAVVGAGISGLGAALALSERHEVVLIEKDRRFGGHANTVEVDCDGRRIPVDTGFIVFNKRNYPNFSGMLEHLGAPTRWSDMSFGFSLGGGAFEYACDNLDKIFAQRLNWMNPGHLRMVGDIARFNRTSRIELAEGRLVGLTLGEWLRTRGYSERFRDRFILPMGGAIWSTSTKAMLAFPAENFVAFFDNHDLMTGLDPAQRWRTVEGGSREYVRRAVRALGPRALLGLEVKSVRRVEGRVRIGFSDGTEDAFDHVVMALSPL